VKTNLSERKELGKKETRRPFEKKNGIEGLEQKGVKI